MFVVGINNLSRGPIDFRVAQVEANQRVGTSEYADRLEEAIRRSGKTINGTEPKVIEANTRATASIALRRRRSGVGDRRYVRV